MHPDTTIPVPAGDDTPPVAARRAGHLYPQVAAHLAAHPGQLLKVGDITRAIGAPSAGAVFEALKRMTAAGYAVHHPSPHRFEVTAAGIAGTTTLPPPTPRPTGPAAARGGRRQPLTRPNGELYFPRHLAGGIDVDVLRRLRDKHIPALLYGPPGTGKTAVVEAAFPDLITLAGTGDTLVDDFVGSYAPLPDTGGYEFIHSPLVTAMREGRALLIDDATLIPPRVLSVLYPALDGRHVITLTTYRNERVEATDGFYVIAAHNLPLTERHDTFEQLSDLMRVGSLGVPWTVRSMHHGSWRDWWWRGSGGCRRLATRGSRTCCWTRPVKGSTRPACSCGTCRPPGGRRRRCARTAWTCCAGSGSCGRSMWRGSGPPGSRPATSATGSP